MSLVSSAVRVLADLKADHPEAAIIVGMDGTYSVPESNRTGWWADAKLPSNLMKEGTND